MEYRLVIGAEELNGHKQIYQGLTRGAVRAEMKLLGTRKQAADLSKGTR